METTLLTWSFIFKIYDICKLEGISKLFKFRKVSQVVRNTDKKEKAGYWCTDVITFHNSHWSRLVELNQQNTSHQKYLFTESESVFRAFEKCVSVWIDSKKKTKKKQMREAVPMREYWEWACYD